MHNYLTHSQNEKLGKKNKQTIQVSLTGLTTILPVDLNEK